MADIDYLDQPDAFCCCEFIDRHGKRSHLSDASACDDMLLACCTCSPPALRNLLADLNDRIRLPHYNGAVHLGFDGLLALVAVPYLGTVAAKGPVETAALVTIMPVAFAMLHRSALRARHRARFFVIWSATSFVYGNLVFTTQMGGRVPFACWLVCAVMQLGAAANMHAVLRTQLDLGNHLTDGDDSGDDIISASSQHQPLVPIDACVSEEGWIAAQTCNVAGCAGSSKATVAHVTSTHQPPAIRCALCGRVVPGYDHHCIWLDACIGAHNLGAFLRGLLWISCATGLQAGLCLALAAQRCAAGWDPSCWGCEVVGALYAAAVSLSAITLLNSIGLNLARGLTAYEARYRRRQHSATGGSTMPPADWRRLAHRLGGLLCPSAPV